MFGRRRIRQLEAEIAVLNAALDFYAINDNWKRRAKHTKGRHWELSAAGKDHGARAREAQLKAKAIRRGPLATVADGVRDWIQKLRTARETERAIAQAAGYLKHHTVAVPLPLNHHQTPDSRLTGETA